MWLSAFEIGAPLQKSRQNHRSYVWTGGLSGMVFPPTQELSGSEWEHGLNLSGQINGVFQDGLIKKLVAANRLYDAAKRLVAKRP